MLTTEEITEIVLRQRLPLTAHIATVTRNFHLAEDVYQEVCVKAIGQVGKLESPQHLMNWFRVASRNRAIDVIRTREGRYVGLSDEAMSILESEWTETSLVPDNDRVDALSQCIESLSERSRQIVRMRYFENRSGKEIASFMDAKIASAYQAIARIHKALAECVRRRMEAETV
ncbi:MULTISPECIES: sigma-70 family RNA polymerase sigma factor [Crateriforma]|uniref:RNA polymerase sigma factor n=1 Tax=Crateriforma conspicua TaxID=2527996 RepID=A0A5C6FM88_9PLAN|nr:MULTISPECIES: sigma-70 family RNA polymerase sigma factor [Crateriforma]QDV62833.1 RNA polymerase sigma factor [Crateriforma conspicua]TWT68405.1 RNA polymerase sigma factor [Crateriforma conspicua]TWU61758.1 RNA polymerase sigma factor [Crateriforma conspicua]